MCITDEGWRQSSSTWREAGSKCGSHPYQCIRLMHRSQRTAQSIREPKTEASSHTPDRWVLFLFYGASYKESVLHLEWPAFALPTAGRLRRESIRHFVLDSLCDCSR